MGLRHSRQDIAHFLTGAALEEVYRDMIPGHDAHSLAEAHRQFQADHLQLVKLFPDTIAVLDSLTEGGRKLATITTRSIRTSVRSLEMTGIAKYFDIVVSAEDVSHHKPHPEPLFKALDVLGMEPSEAVMVGDTKADIMAGKNAGTKTIAALYGFGGERLRETQPDYAIKNLGEILTII